MAPLPPLTLKPPHTVQVVISQPLGPRVAPPAVGRALTVDDGPRMRPDSGGHLEAPLREAPLRLVRVLVPAEGLGAAERPLAVITRKHSRGIGGRRWLKGQV